MEIPERSQFNAAQNTHEIFIKLRASGTED